MLIGSDADIVRASVVALPGGDVWCSSASMSRVVIGGGGVMISHTRVSVCHGVVNTQIDNCGRVRSLASLRNVTSDHRGCGGGFGCSGRDP